MRLGGVVYGLDHLFTPPGGRSNNYLELLLPNVGGIYSQLLQVTLAVT